MISPTSGKGSWAFNRVPADIGVEAAALASELKSRISGEVLFDAGYRALYTTDSSNYRQVPIGVVRPKTVDDIVEAVAACREFNAPVLMRGCGTSLAGQCCNVAVVIDTSKYLHHVLSMDPDARTAWVEPGTVLDNLRDQAENFNLTFASDPATHSHCTLGGMIGNNSCGVHSVMGGKTVDNIEELEILTYDGLRMRVGETSEAELESIIREGGRRAEIYAGLKALRDKYAEVIRKRYPDIPRRVSGYNLDYLLPERGFHVARALVGSEGTCVTVLGARTRLVYSSPARSLLVLGYPDVYSAGDDILEVLDAGPIGLEGIDKRLVENMAKTNIHPEGVRILPDGQGWLLAEFGGESSEESDQKAQKLIDALKRSRKGKAPSFMLLGDPAEQKSIWLVRESGLGATARVPGNPDAWEGWEDSSVHPKDLGNYLRDLRKLFNKYRYDSPLYGHFGQACIHCRITFDLFTTEGIRNFRSFISDAVDLVLSYNGSLSGEHGDGQSRAEFLPRMFGEELLGAFREFKSIWDPQWKMNPGKVVDPYPIDANLRLGTHYRPPSLRTQFKYPEDKRSFSYAILRCVGVGNCRQEHHQTMCPSYMVTREEMHSTRGRSRLLFEMLQGDVIKDGWRSKEVREALDLCLACKGCKGDCPMHVDMATYKAEFLYHYYRHRLRPPDAYSMGLIYWWSRFASRMPRIANFCMQTPPMSTLIKMAGGISTKRKFPKYANRTFRDWFIDRGTKNEGRPKVILWADTFNNYFYPEVAVAGVEALEANGYQVYVPPEDLCCGRPLFDFGMLGLAKYLLRQVLRILRPMIEEGVPVIGLEPACLTTFRDELVSLFPDDLNAFRLSRQSFFLGEFLSKKTASFSPPELKRKALVHGHCSHKSIFTLDSEEQVMKKMGLDYTILDAGCCGVSGAFGFKKSNYDLSVQLGERVLLPAVRGADKSTIIIADGFSCREQIAQMTDRRALHLAQVLCMALQREDGQVADYPERKFYKS